MRFVYTKPRFITFPSTEKKKKKDSSFSLIHPRLKFSLTSPTLFSIKIAASEGREKFPSRGNPRFWGSIVDFYSKKKRKKTRKNTPSDEKGGRVCELLFCRLFPSSAGLESEGRKRGTGFPKKGKRLGMQVACMSRDCIRTHANAINYTRRRERRGNHKRTCYVPDINPASGHKIDYSAPTFLAFRTKPMRLRSE